MERELLFAQWRNQAKITDMADKPTAVKKLFYY
jgi:hypothetical protein